MSQTDAASALPAGPLCPGCGQRGSQDDRFCANCGAELSVQGPPQCPSCKGAIEPDDSFCGTCGAALSADEPMDTGPPAQQEAVPPSPPTAPVVAAEATPPAPLPSPGPPAPEALARPSRFLPGTLAGRIVLAVAAVLAAVAGLTAKEGGPGLALMAVGTLLCLFVVWRNILISFGIIGPAPPTRTEPSVPPEPGQSEPPAEAEGGKSRTCQTVLVLLVILAGIGLARTCGRWLGGLF